MSENTKPKMIGLRHIALRVNNLQECIDFYTKIIGMSLEQGTNDYAYLTSGDDNISLHQNNLVNFAKTQKLEHFGFAIRSPQDVDAWYKYIKQYSVHILGEPKTFGIGTRAFSVLDPSGNEVEFSYHLPIIFD
ncbi:Glutathione transferase fosA [Legionella wadsworthii]|uniref:Glutathione transferase fosA n=1 Tax=Legionella wadsworthii TaxID=28088 RepID=A0A378LVE2_9GAMM|nr:VOC family protein [Legionella wadsworthii]STY29802.1 Glutathione transferase fosA [Legionella wadsworthii]